MNHISIVSPVYRAERIVPVLVERIEKAVSTITRDFEIILVEDGSPDNSWIAIEEAAKKNPRVKGIKLSRNFGQHNAITAGLMNASGQWIVVMDCDLQDKPEEIVKLYQKAQEGFDVVFGKRVQRKDGIFKRLGSKMFYSVYNYFTNSKFDNTVANFSISKKQVIDEFIKLNEQDRSFPLIIQWLGFKIGYAEIEHAERYEGRTSYSFRKLLHFASSSIISQSNRPLKISIALGLFFALCSFLYALFLIYKKLVLGIPVTGWASLMVSMFLIGGLILANLGILGLYLGRVFNEIKGRPLFIIEKKIGL